MFARVPPWKVPTFIVETPSTGWEKPASFGTRHCSNESSARARVRIALLPRSGMELCAAFPFASSVAHSEPLVV